MLSAHSSIDRERYDTFRFPVIAFDAGVPVRTGSALVIINIEDVNDEKPKFNQPSYIFSMSENEPSGTLIGSVSAMDWDGPNHNSFVYGFVSETSVAGTFLIDPSSGAITNQRPLDREMQTVHKFSVVAFDPKAPSMSGTASVIVNVVDKNDNNPEFYFPSRYNDTVYISNRFPVDRVVTEIVVRDADVDANARLSFKLVEDRSDRGIFRIDPSRGTIFVNSKLSDFDYRTFRLTIVASDNGSPSKSQSAELKVHVNRTIPFGLDAIRGAQQSSVLTGYGLIIIVILASGGLILILLLIVAMFVVRRRETNKRMRKQNSRMEALRILTSSNPPMVSPNDYPERSSPTRKLPQSNGGACNGDSGRTWVSLNKLYLALLSLLWHRTELTVRKNGCFKIGFAV